MIDRRRFLGGSTALLALPARASAVSPEAAAEIDLALEAAPSFVVAEGARPLAALRLAGSAPGRIPQGRAATLRVRNGTTEAAGLTTCGLRGWGASDAASVRSLDAIAPGQGAAVPFATGNGGTVLVRASPSPASEAQRGAAAVLVVAEASPPPVDHDVVLMLQDWLLGPDGTLRFGSVPPADAVSRAVTVNGRVAPDRLTAAPRARLRLRLVNASTQRAMLVACEGAQPSVIAVDGQPSALFAPARGAVPIGPGCCFEMMVDLPDAAEREVRVLLRGTERLGGVLEPDRPLLVIRTAGPARASLPPVTALPPNPALPAAIPLERAKRFDLTFGAGPGSVWTVNGEAARPDPVLTVRVGDTVTFGLVNATPRLVPIRVRGQAMRVLHALDDGWDPYWRESVLLPPGGRAHVAFVATAPGRWPVEGAFDDQLLAGLRCWYVVKPR